MIDAFPKAAALGFAVGQAIGMRSKGLGHPSGRIDAAQLAVVRREAIVPKCDQLRRCRQKDYSLS